MFTEILANALRAIASTLQMPVMAILVIILAVTLFMVGTLVVEVFTERRHLKAKLPELADKLAAGGNLKAIIDQSGLLKRQRAAIKELLDHPQLTPVAREALAIRLIAKEKARYGNILRITDIIVRIGPMFGLLGTLIPLGPGIIALGYGDTQTLSTSIQTAFDTTVAGLISAAVAFVISDIRKKWYADYMASLEMITECVLEALDAA
jgi:biopolymer transport protein ExbB/TolQ